MKVIIEVQEHDNKRLEKISINQGTPISIGRSWQSDVIVQDEYVDATHLELSLNEKEQLFIADSGSANGAFFAKKKVEGLVQYAWGEKIRIGGTLLRIHNVEQAVQPTLALSIWQTISRVLSSKKALLLTTLALVFVFVLYSILAQEKESRFSNFLPMISSVFIGLFVWSLLIGFVGRLFRHEGSAKAHWGFNGALIVAVMIVGYLLQIIQFNIPVSLFHQVSGALFLTSIIVLFIYGTLSFTSFLTHKVKLTWSLFIAILPAAALFLMPLFEEDHENWSAWVINSTPPKPPAFLLAQPQPLEEYMQEVDELFLKVSSED